MGGETKFLHCFFKDAFQSEKFSGLSSNKCIFDTKSFLGNTLENSEHAFWSLGLTRVGCLLDCIAFLVSVWHHLQGRLNEMLNQLC